MASFRSRRKRYSVRSRTGSPGFRDLCAVLRQGKHRRAAGSQVHARRALRSNRRGDVGHLWAANPDAPILVFIHGGYWWRLSSKEFSLVARGTVALGITTVVTNYALCPKVTLPEITRQSRAAISWLYRSDHPVVGNRNRLFVAGHSAGGHQVGRLLAPIGKMTTVCRATL